MWTPVPNLARMHQSLCGLMLFVCLFTFTPSEELSAAPRTNSYYDQNAIALQEIRDSVESFRHEINNHEAEIRIFDEKLKNLDSIIENVRDQLNDSNKSHKEQLKGSSTSLESKILALEALSKSLVSDLKQFKTHANDSTVALGQYKQKIGELEKIVEQQSQNIDHLQAAMHDLMNALQLKDSLSSKSSPEKADVALSPGKYRVKTGDTLEKIARAHQTTVQALKELNGISTDKICVGKVLNIPEK